MMKTMTNEYITRVVSDFDSFTEIENGVNETYKISKDANEYILKFGVFDAESARAEPLILQSLSEFITTPFVYDYGSVDKIPYMLLSYIDGKTYAHAYELPIDKLTELSNVLGENLAKMHQWNVSPGQLVRKKDTEQLVTDYADWNTFFNSFLDKIITQLQQDFPSWESRICEIRNELTIPSCETTVFSPIDYHVGNVIEKPSNEYVFIDFERCYGGHRGLSYYNTLHGLTVKRPKTEKLKIKKAFDNGYNSIENNIPKYDPIFDFFALIREMRACRIWWDDHEKERDRYDSALDDLV